eukprot:scaffold144929_cov25-Tisochrysis_lutea.AAC.1
MAQRRRRGSKSDIHIADHRLCREGEKLGLRGWGGALHGRCHLATLAARTHLARGGLAAHAGAEERTACRENEKRERGPRAPPPPTSLVSITLPSRSFQSIGGGGRQSSSLSPFFPAASQSCTPTLE